VKKPDELRLMQALWDAAGRQTYKTLDLLAVSESLNIPWKRAYYISTKRRELEGGCSDRYIWFRDPLR
jgi:hypothetical protein